MFNTISLCLDSISFMYLFDLSRYSLHWFQSYNSIQLIYICIIKRIEFHSLFCIPFNYLYSDVLPFTFQMEDVERRSQSCSDENDWFSPDLMRNTRGRLRSNIPSCSKYSRLPTFQLWSYRYPVIHILRGV